MTSFRDLGRSDSFSVSGLCARRRPKAEAKKRLRQIVHEWVGREAIKRANKKILGALKKKEEQENAMWRDEREQGWIQDACGRVGTMMLEAIQALWARQ